MCLTILDIFSFFLNYNYHLNRGSMSTPSSFDPLVSDKHIEIKILMDIILYGWEARRNP